MISFCAFFLKKKKNSIRRLKKKTEKRIPESKFKEDGALVFKDGRKELGRKRERKKRREI